MEIESLNVAGGWMVPSAHFLREKIQQFRKILEQFEAKFPSMNASDAKVPWQIS